MYHFYTSYSSVKGSPLMHGGSNTKEINKTTRENETYNLSPLEQQDANVTYLFEENNERSVN